MRRFLAIMGSAFKSTWRDRVGLFFTFLFPVVFVFCFFFAFGTKKGNANTTMVLVIVNQDTGVLIPDQEERLFLAQKWLDGLTAHASSEDSDFGVKLLDAPDEVTAKDMVLKNRAHGALLIPPDYSEVMFPYLMNVTVHGGVDTTIEILRQGRGGELLGIFQEGDGSAKVTSGSQPWEVMDDIFNKDITEESLRRKLTDELGMDQQWTDKIVAWRADQVTDQAAEDPQTSTGTGTDKTGSDSFEFWRGTWVSELAPVKIRFFTDRTSIKGNIVPLFIEQSSNVLSPDMFRTFMADLKDETEDEKVKALAEFLADDAWKRPPAMVGEEIVNEGPKYSSFDYIFPGLLVFAILTMVNLGAAQLTEEYEWGRLRRYRLAGVGPMSLILAFIGSAIGIGFLQMLEFYVLGKLLGWQGGGGPLLKGILICFPAIVASMAVGIALASFQTKSQHAAGAASMVSVPLAFLSGVFFDMPRILPFGEWRGVPLDLFSILPWSQTATALKRSFLFDAGWDDLFPHLVISYVSAFDILVLAMLLYTYRRWKVR